MLVFITILLLPRAAPRENTFKNRRKFLASLNQLLIKNGGTISLLSVRSRSLTASAYCHADIQLVNNVCAVQHCIYVATCHNFRAFSENAFNVLGCSKEDIPDTVDLAAGTTNFSIPQVTVPDAALAAFFSWSCLWFINISAAVTPVLGPGFYFPIHGRSFCLPVSSVVSTFCSGGQGSHHQWFLFLSWNHPVGTCGRVRNIFFSLNVNGRTLILCRQGIRRLHRSWFSRCDWRSVFIRMPTTGNRQAANKPNNRRADNNSDRN
jgi:hypothetical protein